jgi:hypothetical protein
MLNEHDDYDLYLYHHGPFVVTVVVRQLRDVIQYYS